MTNTTKPQPGGYAGFIEAMQGIHSAKPSKEIDEVLRQAADAIHRAFEENRQPSSDPDVLRLLARAGRMRTQGR